MIVNLFKHGSDDFIQMLNEASIEYEERRSPLGVVTNAPEAIEIIQALAGLSIAPSLAAVMVQWLKSKAHRIIMLDDGNGRTTRIEGYTVKEVEKLLSNTTSVMVIQAKPDNKNETASGQ